VNAVAPGLRADINHGVTLAGSASVEDLVAPHQAKGKRIHQRIAGVAGLELGLAAEVGYAEAVAERSDPADHTIEHRMVLVQLFFRDVRSGCDRSKPQRIHDGHRTRTHGEDVP